MADMDQQLYDEEGGGCRDPGPRPLGLGPPFGREWMKERRAEGKGKAKKANDWLDGQKSREGSNSIELVGEIGLGLWKIAIEWRQKVKTEDGRILGA
jgi:hypothetical protein